MADALRLILLFASLMVIAGSVAVVLTVVAARRLTRAARFRLAGVFGRPSPAPDRVTSRRLLRVGASEAWLLPLRAFVPGPTRPIAALRWELTRDARSAARAIDAGIAAGRPLEELRGSAAQVVAVASGLDLDLAVISGEPDEDTRRALLTERADQIDALRRACAQLRHGVLLAGGGPAPATLPRYLRDDLDEQVDRLRLTAEAYQHLATPSRDRRSAF